MNCFSVVAAIFQQVIQLWQTERTRHLAPMMCRVVPRTESNRNGEGIGA